MAGTVCYVRYGAPALDELVAVVKRHQAGDPLAPVAVVASSRRAGGALRHLLAGRLGTDGRHGVANVRFLVLSDIAEEFGGERCRAQGRHKASRAALTAAARAALGRRPGFLAAVADHPATEDELVACYEDLRQAVPESEAAFCRLGERETQLSQLCAAMRERLVGSWFDDADVAEEAALAIEEQPLGDVLGPVVVYLPERARQSELRVLAALSRAGECLVMLGLVGEEPADAPALRVAAALEEAGFSVVSVPQASLSVLGPDGPLALDERLVAHDEEAEVQAAVRLVLEALEQGASPGRLALLYPSGGGRYRRLLAVALAESGVCWSGLAAATVAQSPPGCLVTGLVGLAVSGLERAAVMRWLRAAPVRQGDGTLVPVEAYERVSRKAGIVSGEAAAWHERLEALTIELRGAASGEEAAAPSEAARQRRARGDLEACRALDEFVAALASDLAEARRLRRWSELSGWAKAALERYYGVASEETPDEDPPVVRLVAALDELGELDALDEATDVERFGRALGRALEVRSYVGKLSVGVVVGELAAAVGLELDLAVVLGAVEGELPGRARSGPLLSRQGREALGVEAASPRAVVTRDRRSLLAVVAGARRVVISYRQRDAGDGRARVRSRFLVADAAPRVDGPVDALAGVSRGALVALSEPELVTATLLGLGRERGALEASYLVADDALAAGVAVMRTRAARAFDRFSGRVGESGSLLAYGESGFSPTTLEDYACCPFRFFLGHELRCEVVEAPEQRLEMSPLDRGSAIHEILERFVSGIISGRPDRAEDLGAIAEEVLGRYEQLGKTGVAALWPRRRRQLLRTLEQVRAGDAEVRRRRGSVPVAVEWRFGPASDTAATFELEDGQSVRFRGAIDRVDRDGDGTLEVIDYKSGRSSPYAAMRDDPLERGRRLQLVVYALAAGRGFAAQGATGAVRASYRFVDEGGKEITVALDDVLVERASSVLSAVVSGVRAGSFPFNPGRRQGGQFEHCRYCPYDAVCPTARGAFWARARRDRSLAGYVALVEGAAEEVGAE